ncbi:MAG: aminodeoxychorismate/anthranilate synthase component II [Clostridiales bacterium]|nr:aminodeoxychorismate/anthranilate synthase component II [Clostridiales bacterium]
MLLIIDNYDSFSYNLYQLIGGIYPDIRVIRNDAMTVSEIEALAPDAIVISPGPGRPSDAGVCIDVIRELGPKIPMLGVCLGHQAICEAFGATVTYAKELMHGKQSVATVDPTSKLYRGMTNRIKVARYHSLAADPDTIPECLRVTAKTDDGEIMGIKHASYDIYGVQFHPESILTPDGKTILKNFIDIAMSKR